MERSKGMANKKDLVRIKKVLSNTDVIEACTKEAPNTKWKFYKRTNVTVFVVSLKEVPTGCKDAVLPETLTKDHIVNCLTHRENTKKLYNNNFMCL